MRKWPWMLGVAVLSAALAALSLLGKDANDALWGFSAGIAIGALFSWLAERG